MPCLTTRSATGRRSYITPILAAATAVAIAVALTACTSASSTPATAHVSVAGASTVRITGAGSTFDAPFFTRAFAAYQQSRPSVAVNYAAVGSSAGITRFTAGT